MINFIYDFYGSLLKKTILNKRLYILIGFLSFCFSLTSYFSPGFALALANIVGFSNSSSTLTVLLFLVSVFAFALLYLQSGEEKVIQENDRDSDITIKKLIHNTETNRRRIDELFAENDNLKNTSTTSISKK